MLWILPKRVVASAKPRLPDGVRIYAVGDLHGRSDLLDRVLWHIDRDLERHPTGRAIEVFLGDYIDRGPDSRGVLDRLIERNWSRELVFLKGNHETYVLEFLQNPQVLDEWAQFGGFETLMSYGLKPSMDSISATQEGLAIAFADVLPQSHRRFLKALRLSFSCGDFFFAHAGIKPGVPLIAQKEQHLVWIRDDFLHCEWDHGQIIIHGHTPVREPDVRSNRINIDTGAFATGRLTCLMLERDQAAFIAENRTWLYGREGKLAEEVRLAADPSGKREGSLQPPNEADQPTSDESRGTLQPSAPISDPHSVPPLAQDCSPRPPRMAPGMVGSLYVPSSGKIAATADESRRFHAAKYRFATSRASMTHLPVACLLQAWNDVSNSVSPHCGSSRASRDSRLPRCPRRTKMGHYWRWSGWSRLWKARPELLHDAADSG